MLSIPYQMTRLAAMTKALVQSALTRQQGHRCMSTIGETAHRRPYVPRRACLYVPGNDKRKITKATTVGADSVILDCEDGVALNRKAEARETIRDILDTTTFGHSESAVRVNSETSGLMEEDLDVIMKANKAPSTIYLPKVEYPHQLDRFSDALNASHRKSFTQIPVVICVESAMSVLNLRDILLHASHRPSNTAFYVDGVLFGSDDFCADIGVSRSPDDIEVMYARQSVVLTAKAFGLQVIDMVHIDFKDLATLHTKCQEGVRLGFTGKQVVHPDQVGMVQEVFSPSDDAVVQAEELVRAFGEHQKTGQGAFSYNDRMIDMPTVLQARNIIEVHRKVTS